MRTISGLDIICLRFVKKANGIISLYQYVSTTVNGRNLTLSYVKPRRLREAIYDEFEGLRCGVHCPGQSLDTAGPNLALHTLSQDSTPDLVCTPTHDGQKSGREWSLWKKYVEYSAECEH